VTGRATSTWRRLSRAFAGSGVAVSLGAFYIRLVSRTTRWTVIGREGWEALAARPGGFICTSWHGRLFLSPTYAPSGNVGGKKAVAMISISRDGDLFTRIVERWGVAAVRGSSHDHVKRRRKGGGRAYAGAVRELTTGALIGITPDGPRGPRMRAQAGVARLAASTGVPVVAIGFSVRWGVHLSSWDRFLLPLPFGRGAVVYSEPRRAPTEDSPQALEQFCRALETDLNDVTNRADDICGRARVPPAELAPL